MEQDILAEVIEAEREIQKFVEHEQVRAREQVEISRKEAGEQLAGLEEELSREFHAAMAAAEGEAKRKAEEAVQEGEARTEQLRSVEGTVLAGMVKRLIKNVLPE